MAGRKKEPQLSLKCYLDSLEEKEALQQRLESVKQRLAPSGRAIDNAALMSAMLDSLEEKLATSTPTHSSVHGPFSGTLVTV